MRKEVYICDKCGKNENVLLSFQGNVNVIINGKDKGGLIGGSLVDKTTYEPLKNLEVNALSKCLPKQVDPAVLELRQLVFRHLHYCLNCVEQILHDVPQN